MGSVIRTPNHLKSGQMATILSTTICNLNKNFRIISLSFCLFSYNGVCNDGLELSVSDIIVCHKGFNGDRKLQFFGRHYNFTRSLCARINLGAKIQWRMVIFVQKSVFKLSLHFALCK